VSSSGVTGSHAVPKVKGPGVVTGRYGTLGEVFYIREDFWPLNTSLYVQDFKGNDPRFVAYFLGHLDLASRNAAGAVPGINRNHLHAMDVHVPRVQEQRRIAAVLAAYDDLIENNLRRIRVLEEMARALYREWFVEFRYPGSQAAGATPFSGLTRPTGWTQAKLADMVATQYGYTESASVAPVGPRYLRGMDINKRTCIDWDTVPYCPIADDEKHNYSLRKGDVVVIRMADPGKVGIVEEEVDAVFASYLIRLTPKSGGISPYFLFYTLLSDNYQGYISGAATGTTRKSASAGVITDFQIDVPPRALLESFEPPAPII